MSPAVATLTAASASASSSGGNAALGTATTVMPAAAAERSPFEESSIATQVSGPISSRRAASRYTSGAGLPRGTSSEETTAANGHPVSSRTASMTSRLADDANPSGQREPSERTASPAPGSNGSSSRYPASMRSTTSRLISSASNGTPSSSRR